MGQELSCTARWGSEASEGKAMLESDFVLFRGTFRVKAMFKDFSKVEAADGVLLLGTPDGRLELDLGGYAEKWAKKILNPPSRLDKLGVKEGAAVALVGEFPEDFGEELRSRETVSSSGKQDIIFLACATGADLGRVPALRKRLKPDGGLWVVYPKGVKTITEVQVIQAGRNAGLKDVKVASFSPTLTALRFVIALAERG